MPLVRIRVYFGAEYTGPLLGSSSSEGSVPARQAPINGDAGDTSAEDTYANILLLSRVAKVPGDAGNPRCLKVFHRPADHLLCTPCSLLTST